MLYFATSPFYTFVSLALLVLYQFESLHFDDYNLTYSKNKNMSFLNFLTATPLKTQHFPFYNHSNKPIQTNTNQQYSSKLNPTQPKQVEMSGSLDKPLFFSISGFELCKLVMVPSRI